MKAYYIVTQRGMNQFEVEMKAPLTDRFRDNLQKLLTDHNIEFEKRLRENNFVMDANVIKSDWGQIGHQNHLHAMFKAAEEQKGQAQWD